MALGLKPHISELITLLIHGDGAHLVRFFLLFIVDTWPERIRGN